MTTHPRIRESGFTLIEVMVSLGIAALIFTSVFWGLDQTIRTREALSNPATPYVVGPAILDVIAGDLANAYFYDYKENNVFYGTNAELNGAAADAISFLACSKTYAPEEYNGAEDRRHSFLNEIAYMCRRGPAGSRFLELWRREDFYVDDSPHAGGDYVLLYDKVASLDFLFVSRNPQNAEGVAGSREKDAEQMLQEGWNSTKENGVPRAMQIVLSIYARDDEQDVATKTAGGQGRVYTFKRFISLPQVHMSLTSESQIASWDGTINEPSAAVVAGNRGGNPAGGPGTPVGGAGGRGRGQGDGQGQPNPRVRQQNQGPGVQNPFLDVLRQRGARPSTGSSGNPFSGLVPGGGR